MLRTQYVVVEHDGLWRIRFEGRHYGQYHSRREALRAAIDAAYKAAQAGAGSLPPRVLAQSRFSSEMQTEWTYGQDPYPPHLEYDDTRAVARKRAF